MLVLFQLSHKKPMNLKKNCLLNSISKPHSPPWAMRMPLLACVFCDARKHCFSSNAALEWKLNLFSTNYTNAQYFREFVLGGTLCLGIKKSISLFEYFMLCGQRSLSGDQKSPFPTVQHNIVKM